VLGWTPGWTLGPLLARPGATMAVFLQKQWIRDAVLTLQPHGSGATAARLPMPVNGQILKARGQQEPLTTSRWSNGRRWFAGVYAVLCRWKHT